MTRKALTIPLGFEVGTGEPVSIPLAHTAVTGQTQAAGKTTALEALISRAGSPGKEVAAIAFVTKRGEGAFGASGGGDKSVNQLQPYFRDRADWQFVTSLLDAVLAEKNKFLRPWIMKICRNTKTLGDVHAAVKAALAVAVKKHQGLNEGVYTQLDAYLDIIVPEINRTPLAKSMQLKPGLNVMDLSGFPTAMQMLFVQSAIDWVNDHERDTVVIVPEAWEFIPEGKNTPVKASAVDLVRKGAGIGNFVWVDSQDMAGVDKVILRGCTVWLIGVQREANEIKRALLNIPADVKKPKPADIARLGKGEFFACWRAHVHKVYVQPAWLAPEVAQAYARGEISIEELQAHQPLTTHWSTAAEATPLADIQAVKDRLLINSKQEQHDVTEKEAEQLRAENAELRKQLEELKARLPVAVATTDSKPSVTHPGRHEVEVKFVSPNAASADLLPANRTPTTGNITLGELPAGSWGDSREEQLYQGFKARLIAELPGDARVMQIVLSRPELTVQVKREQITAEGYSLRGRVAVLISEGYFDTGQSAPGTQKELARRGNDPGPANLYKELDALAALGFLTIEQGKDDRSRPRKEYRAVQGMKVNVVEVK